MYSFAEFFCGPYIFAKLRWKNVKKRKKIPVSEQGTELSSPGKDREHR
jgi:hypothetical protein